MAGQRSCPPATYFYPRPPRGGRRGAFSWLQKIYKFLSTPSARRATGRPKLHPMSRRFLSTPSARRATTAGGLDLLGQGFLSTPSARRATRCQRIHDRRQCISIHALREEGDPAFVFGPDLWVLFLSTPSARRATLSGSCFFPSPGNFYPRPPRGGRPTSPLFLTAAMSNFYPRPPRGGRLYTITLEANRSRYFYPRPPRGGRPKHHPL